MEHRLDLERLLLDGLPHQERVHVAKVMRKVTAEKTRRLRAHDVRDNDAIDVTELEPDDDDGYPEQRARRFYP